MCYCNCFYEDWEGSCTRSGRIPWDGECQRRRRAEEEAERREAQCPQPGEEEALCLTD